MHSIQKNPSLFSAEHTVVKKIYSMRKPRDYREEIKEKKQPHNEVAELKNKLPTTIKTKRYENALKDISNT